MDRNLLLLASVLGFLGVALGAFGAHGLKKRLAALPDGDQRLAWWQTGAQYHLVHALAVGLASFVAPHAHAVTMGTSPPNPGVVAGWLFCVGIVLFSGSLYAMTLTGKRVLGAVTPVGGVLFLAGWVAFGASALMLAP